MAANEDWKVVPEDQVLREKLVDKVLEFHRGNNPDTKRIIQDLEALYRFIKGFKL